MVDISVVTSLYQSEKFLPKFLGEVVTVAQALHTLNHSFEIVIVANDASELERRLVDEFARQATTFHVKPIYVGRESVYASWNRGVEGSQGDIIGFWNVDDIRMAEALVEAHQVLNSQENKLIYFPYLVVRVLTAWNDYTITWKELRSAIPFNQNLFRRKMKAGPFFMFKRALYTQTGPFDSRFKIAGDLEWCVRAMQHTDFIAGEEIVGELVIHGDNLSGVFRPLENVEKNMIFLMHDMPEEVMPADPDLMRKTLNAWKVEGIQLSPELEAKLFGDDAQEAWQDWLVQQQKILKQRRFSKAVRFFPQQLINKSGLRPVLRRLGVVKGG